MVINRLQVLGWSNQEQHCHDDNCFLQSILEVKVLTKWKWIKPSVSSGYFFQRWSKKWKWAPIPPWHPSFTFTISSALTLKNHGSLCTWWAKVRTHSNEAWQGFVSMSPKWWTTYAESEANEKQSTCCVSISPFHEFLTVHTKKTKNGLN